MSYIKKQIIHQRKLKDRQIIITEDGNIELNPINGTVSIDGNLTVTGGAPGPQNSKVYYVSEEGNDLNTGLSSDAGGAKRTIKAAVAAAPEGATIYVAPGNFYEDNPITVKKRQTILGSSLRTTQVWPLNNIENIFLVDNAVYLAQFTFRGLRDPGWCVAIKPGAFVLTSPYVQNCSNINGPWLNDGTEFIPFETVQIEGIAPGAKPIINNEAVPLEKRVNETGGGNGMLVDGDEYDPNSLVKSMVADSFTQIAQGGIGFLITNFGYTQIVSCFSVFTRIGFLATKGGYLSISNSVSDFGTFGLLSDGIDDESYTTGKVAQEYYSTVASVTMVNIGLGYTSNPTVTIDPPDSPAGVQATGTATIDPVTGTVTGVTITNSGSGYTSVPNVTFTGGGFSIQATGDVNLLPNFNINVSDLRDIPQVGSIIQFENDPIQYYITSTETVTQPFIYNESTCRRDTGYIFDAVLGDSVFTTDYQSIVAGRSYLRKSASAVLLDQKEPTIYALEQLKERMLARLPSGDPSNTFLRNSVTARLNDVISIIDTENVGNFTLADLATIDSGTINSKNNIFLNRDFIIEEITAYIDDQFTNLIYDQATFRRDIEFIVEALKRDILLNTNHNSIAYIRGATDYEGESQLPATIIALRYAKTLILNNLIQDTVAASRALDRLDIILEIIETGSLPSEGTVYNAPSNATQARIDGVRQLIDNRDFLVAETIAYIDQTYPSLAYDSATYARNTGYIIDSVVHDLLYGGNRSTNLAAVNYRKEIESQASGQGVEIADSIDHLSAVAQLLIEGNTITPTIGNSDSPIQTPGFGSAEERQLASDLFDIGSTAITDGTTSVPPNANPDYDWVDLSLFTAVSTMVSRLNQTQDMVIDYIENNIKGFTYNVVTCERDVDYTIDAAVYDMMYGGNKQTRRAAQSYYNNAVIPGQEAFTEFTFKHLANVLNAVAQNILIISSAGTGATYAQNTSGTAGSEFSSNYIKLMVDKIAEVIEFGNSALPDEINHDYSTLGNAIQNAKRIALIADYQAIENEVINLLNAEYGGEAVLTIFPGLISALPSQQANLVNVSTISTSGHAFEYVGAGITYNALPFYGGVPIEANNFVETNGGKVFAGGVVDQVGNFKVGNFFEVSALTGSITLQADQINLQGISSLGPFRRQGIPVGVELREVSNNPDLSSSLGYPDPNTVPTQVAVVDYITARYLPLVGGTIAGDLTVENNLTVENDLTVDNNLNVIGSLNLSGGIGSTTNTFNIALTSEFINIAADTGITTINNDATVKGNLIIAGADDSATGTLQTNSTTFKLLDDTVDYLYIGGEASFVDVGSPSSIVTLNNNLNVQNDTTVEGDFIVNSGNVITDSSVVSLFEQGVDTVNAFLSASQINIGNVTGTTQFNTDVIIDGYLFIAAQDDSSTGRISSTADSFDILTDVANINLGKTDGFVNIRSQLNVSGNITTDSDSINLFNNTPTSINFGNSATDISIGSLSSVVTINDDLQVNGDLNVDGGDITTTATSFSLLNTFVQTLSFANASTDINIGAAFGTLTINNEIVILNSTAAIQIPVGDELQRPTAVTGQIRFNTDSQVFEGYDGIAWGSLGGVKDVDGNTLIRPETAPGANNNQLEFFADGTKVAQLDINGLIVYPTTNSTDYNSGALVVKGGVGIDENLFVRNNLRVYNTSLFEDDVVMTGNLTVGTADSVVNDFTVVANTSITVYDDTLSAFEIKTDTNSLLKLDTASGAATLTVDATTDVVINSATTSTTASTGALIVGGGAGISENLNVGGNAVITGDIEVNSGNLTTESSGFNLINLNATTVNFAGDASTINVGAATGIITFNNEIAIFDSTKAIQIPVGETADRPIAVTGQIRFNTTDSTFEGYDGNNWGSLGGVKDIDGNTFIRPETAPGANNNQLEFFADGTKVAQLDKTGLIVYPTTNSTDYSTGSLVVKGGVGIDENLFVRNNLRVYNTSLFEDDVVMTGSLTVGTADSVIDSLNVTANTQFNIYDDTSNTFEILLGLDSVLDITTAAGSAAATFGSITDVVINSATASTTVNTGALVVAGGVGIGENLFVNSNLAVNGNTITTTSASFDLLNTNATTVNFAGDASTINVGAATGTLTINNELTVFDSVKAIQIPVGETADRPTEVTGQIRFNTTDTQFEGYNGIVWTGLGGVIDANQDTKITAEDTPGANNDQLKFFTNGVQRFIIDQTVAAFDSTIETVTYGATTSSTSKDTGAIVVEGGVGIEENLYVGGRIGGDLTIGDTTNNVLTLVSSRIEGEAPYTVSILDDNNNTVIYPITLEHKGTGVLGTGIGTGIAFSVETQNDNIETCAVIDIVSTNITNTAENFDMIFKVMTNGLGPVEKLRLSDTTSTFTTNVTIDQNLIVTGQLDAASFKGSVFADDSSLMIDAINNAIFADSATITNLTLNAALNVPSGGTGATTFTDNGILYGNGTDPIQATAEAGTADASNSYQILTTVSAADSTPVWTDTLDGGSFGGAEGGGGVTSDPDGTLVVGSSIRFDDFSVVVASEIFVATLTPTAIDTFEVIKYRSAKATIQVTDTITGEHQLTEVMIIHNGINAYLTAFGTIFTGNAPLATFDADILNADVRILTTNATTNHCVYKIQRTSITV